MNECQDACCSPRRPIRDWLKSTQSKISNWLYLNIWCRYLYARVMRFTHKHGWHYAPARHYIPGDLAHEHHHWCQWCGLRGTTYDPNYQLTPKLSKDL